MQVTVSILQFSCFSSIFQQFCVFFFSAVVTEAKDLIRMMLNPDPKARLVLLAAFEQTSFPLLDANSDVLLSNLSDRADGN